MPSTGTIEGATGVLVEWRIHLAARDRAKARVVLALVAAAAVVAYVAFSHPLAPLLTAGALLASVSEFLFPVSYRVTGEGVERHNGLSHAALAWGEIRRCEADPEGVTLSPLAAPSYRDSFRSIYLRFPADPEARSRLEQVLRERDIT